jgi:hypothetical protein
MSFSLRTFDVREGGKNYKVTLRVPQEKSLDDFLTFLAERARTSNVFSQNIGPFEMVVRESR